jgi:hypothetical protein
MALKRIHINRQIIAANKQRVANGELEHPPISVVTRGKTYRAFAVEIEGPSRLIYRPSRPLRCGATTWIETLATIRYVEDRPLT